MSGDGSSSASFGGLLTKIKAWFHPPTPQPAPGAKPPAPAAAPPAQPATAAAPATDDGYEADKARLRALSTWIVGVFGAIATIMVAGSQLTDLGTLDSTTQASLFGWHQTRFEFAVIGLGVMLGGAATAITLAVWVQITSTLSLAELARFPTKPEQRILAWRVRARVRRTIERDLKTRGVEKTGTERLTTVIKGWHDARVLEHATRDAAVALERELTRLRNPLPIAGRCTGARPRDADLVDWLDGPALVRRAEDLAASANVKDLTETQATALKAFHHQLDKNYEHASNETRNRYELVQRIIEDASYFRMRFSFGMVLKYIVAAAIASGVGICLFAWSTHPPKTDQRKPTVLVVPASTIKAAHSYLGKDCDPATLKITTLGDPKLIAISATSNDPARQCVLK